MIRILGRKKVAKRIFWVLAIIIVPSFVIWGVGEEMRGTREQYLAARVNRENITRERYYRHLQELLEQYRQYQPEGFDEDEYFREEIEAQALEDLIRNTLLLQEARRRRLRVTDREVLEAIRHEQAFLDEEGNFDPARFREITQLIPEEEWLRIEADIRKTMLLQKLHREITVGVEDKITGEELAAYREEIGLAEDDIEDAVLRQFLGRQKAQEYFSSWYQELKEAASIKVYLE